MKFNLFLTCSLFFLLSFNIIFAQYFNNIYNHKENPEFQREIHLKDDNKLIEIGSYVADNGNPSIIIRELDVNGQLLSTDVISNDTLQLFLNWTHTSTITDSIFFVIATAQKLENNRLIATYPYFIKYNLNQKKLINLKFYPRKLEHSIHSMVYHTDGYLYGGGYEYLTDGYRNRDMLIMKFDVDGNLIWEKNLNFGETVNQIREIESFENNLIITGLADADTPKPIMAKIDTSAAIINSVFVPTPLGKSGTISAEIYKKDIYFTTTSNVELEDFETQYLAKFTNELQLIWDTLIPNTSHYDVNCRRMEILNDEIIMVHTIAGAKSFTNNEVWTYASSWSLEGEFNWEHVYFYDSTYTHHLDDIEATPDGDLIFMGTVFGNDDYGANQFLWLFKTDADGCGTVQDTCHYTLDRYFGLDSTLHTIDLDTLVTIIGADTIVSINDADTTVHIIEPTQAAFVPIQILGNPFSEVLQIQSNSLLAGKHQIQIHNIHGQKIYEDNLSFNQSIDTKPWTKGIYFLKIIKDDQLVWSEKILKQ